MQATDDGKNKKGTAVLVVTKDGSVDFFKDRAKIIYLSYLT